MDWGVSEVAKLFNVNAETVRRWIRADRKNEFDASLKGVRGRTGIRFSEKVLVSFLNYKTNVPHLSGIISVPMLSNLIIEILRDFQRDTINKKSESKKMQNYKEDFEKIREKLEKELITQEEELKIRRKELEELSKNINEMEVLAQRHSNESDEERYSQTLSNSSGKSNNDKDNTVFEKKPLSMATGGVSKSNLSTGMSYLGINIHRDRSKNKKEN